MEHEVHPVPLCIDTTAEISLATDVPPKGRSRPRSLNKKSMSNPRTPQARQKRRQAEADLISALAATKRTRASTRFSPSVPDLDISDNDLVISKLRRGNHIASKPSSSNPKKSTKAKSKPSPKLASNFKSTKSSTSKSKKQQVASSVSTDSFLSDSDDQYLPQTSPSVASSHLDRISHFRKQSVLRGRVVTGFGGPEMVVLLTKLAVQEWSALFLQGDTQRKMAKKEVIEFYINGKSDELSFTFIHLVPIDVARILGIPSTGWGHYVKLELPPLPIHTSALSISHKLSSKPNLTHHRSVDKNEMSMLHKLYFDVVHKIILPRKQRRTKANFLDLTLMELLDSEVPINLPTLIIKHMHMVLHQDENGHVLPYGFWMAPIFETFNVPVQVWHSQTFKDVVGRVNHVALPVSMRNPDNLLQRLKNQLAAKEDELLALETAHQMERVILEARIVELQTELATTRAANIATM
ncbi:hypothetical protein KY290_037877 [Solanum tuberosum]|uniref:Uncharacterized protein n=1 Tax=Solanum tuberosum TaxID=4113 RepID=A0ABQ7TYL0_SOLTU|nr:hypothetical protein KY284_037251 [Solanum tuberosum]KAH0739172.1 hypothetical protein KY290_037877 [Solanum tuberosum]